MKRLSLYINHSLPEVLRQMFQYPPSHAATSHVQEKMHGCSVTRHSPFTSKQFRLQIVVMLIVMFVDGVGNTGGDG